MDLPDAYGRRSARCRCAFDAVRDDIQRSQYAINWSRDRGCKKARGAIPRQHACNRCDGFSRSVHYIGTARAVHMYVEEARTQRAPR